ncbi:transcription factor SPEECHLESS [Carex littledalei]|uniref:Transcription factor SPEECHLESS n=1 Tax=Carex littledalei TaxID=544730 RepID=A0A833QCH7_9POAL|nr:transcription factor SPEECHLESS [Carex littledalei]
MGEVFVDPFEQSSFDNTYLTGATSPDDLFRILETLEDGSVEAYPFHHFDQSTILISSSGNINQELMTSKPVDASREEKIKIGKKRKFSTTNESLVAQDASHKTSHITVERNRRKQMNGHLSVLRSLMPCFYVKRGDQASIIGGVVDYIKELQQVLQSLQAKKQRKLCSEVLSPIQASSPRLLPHSPPKPPPFSPKLGLPISPRTPLPESPYKRNTSGSYISNKIVFPSQATYLSLEKSNNGCGHDFGIVSSTARAMADVTVEFSGPNVVLKTISQQIPGQVLKIVAALENLSLEILHASINIVDGILLNSFTIKIGIECDLSAEDLVQEIKHTFS